MVCLVLTVFKIVFQIFFFNRWAIIGVAEQSLLGKVDSKTSVLDSGKLQSHMIRLAHLSQQGDSTSTKDALYITYEKE